MNNPSLTEQVRQALATFDEAHRAAETAAAAFADAKRLYGSNKDERTQREKETPPQAWLAIVAHFEKCEEAHKAAVAHLERVEKHLNVTRELLQAENAATMRAWAEIADRTAERYAALQMSLPARPVVMRVEKQDTTLPF